MKKVTLVFGFALCLVLSVSAGLDAGWWFYTVTEPASSSCSGTPLESCTSTNGAYGYQWAHSSSYKYIGFLFTTNNDSSVRCQSGIFLYKVGNPNIDIDIRYYTDNAGMPGTALGTSWSSVVNTTSISTSSTEIIFLSTDVAGGSTLSPNTSYWTILRASTIGDSSNYILLDASLDCTDTKIVYSANGIDWALYTTTRGGRFVNYK